MSTGPKHGWGGKREGAGRKPTTFSAQVLAERRQLAKEIAEQKGKTVDRILLDFIYDEEEKKRDRAAYMKLWYDISEPRIQEGGEADKANGPGIYLPEEKPDPSVVVPIKKTV